MERGNLFELRRVVADVPVQSVREKSPAPVFLLQSAINAANVVVANPVELRRIGHRQRLQHHRMDQGEDGGIGPNSQRQSQDGGDGEARAFPELSKGMAKVVEQVIHGRFSTSRARSEQLSAAEGSAVSSFSAGCSADGPAIPN